jgi:hypothetical protein
MRTTTRPPSAIATATIVLASTFALLLASIVSWGIAFGMGTDCTTWYECGADGCPPCRPMNVWIGAGAVTQLLLAAAGVRAIATGRASIILGLVLMAASVGAIVVTTHAAGESYCRPGTSGFDESYCPGAPAQPWP